MFLSLVLAHWLFAAAASDPIAVELTSWCSADRYEPNDERRRSRPLKDELDAHLCVRDVDWYVFGVERGQQVTIEIGGTKGARVELAAFAPRRRKVAARARGTDTLRLRWKARRSGRYRLRLRHLDGRAVAYRLTRAVRPARARPRKAGE